MVQFSLNDVEEAAANEFMEEHKSCEAVMSTIGTCQYSYIFTPHGLGYNVVIKCNVCGEAKDISDYSCW